MRIDGVSEGRPAQLAGLQEGRCCCSHWRCGGRRYDGLHGGPFQVLKRAKPQTLKSRRGESTLVVEVTWD